MSEGYIIGGGGSALNFKVIAVSSEPLLPATAKENTIAVITTTPITSYVFASTAPTSPTEGMVWFATGTASTVGFNAIKRNGLWVYPTGCQQYVSGAWEQKTVKTYRNSAWVDWWNGYLYDSGNEYDFVTGGWSTTGYSMSGYSISAATKGAAEITFASSTASNLNLQGTQNAVDLTAANTVTIEMTVKNKDNNGYAGQIWVLSGKTITAAVARVVITNAAGSKTTASIDVASLSGSYYIACIALGTSGTERWSMHSMRLD